MFKSKKDRRVVDLTIEFNLTAINRWLSSSGDIKDVEKIEQGHERWEDCFVRLYNIDVLPNGESSDMYFHREKNIISNNIGGIDYLEGSEAGLTRMEKNIKYVSKFSYDETSRYEISDFLKNKNEIHTISWKRWREFLSFEINNKPILLVPIEEFGILMKGGKLNNESKTLGGEKRLIDVPILFSENNQPTEHVKISRTSNSSDSVGYSNALCSVGASALSFEVEYSK